jgi:glycosyltransferase involved in cell wall biosynthesis
MHIELVGCMRAKKDYLDLRLLLLSDAAAPHTRRWANWFAQNGVEVHVVTFNQNLDFGFKNVIIHKLWDKSVPLSKLFRLYRSLYILVKLKLLVRSIKPNLIHSHSLGSYAWVALILMLRPRIVTPWGTDLLIDMANSKINYFLSKISLRSADLVTTDALHFIPIMGKLGVKEEKMFFLTFGTDTQKFISQRPNRNDKNTTIVSTRTLNPVHCVEDLIRAIPEIVKNRPNTNFIIGGGGLQYEAFVNEITQQGLTENVEFTGMLKEDELLKILQMSDIYVSTSMHDAGLAASTAEAMACGLPVVHPDVADNRKWVDETGGSLYEVRNISQLVSRLLYLIDNPSHRVKMGENNRSVIMEHFNLDKNLNSMLRQYTQLKSKRFYEKN